MTRLRSPRTAVLLSAALLASAAAVSTSASAAPRSEARTNSGATAAGASYDRLIVHFRPGTAAAGSDAAAAAEVRAVARDLRVTRRISTGGVLVQVAAPLDKPGADRVVAAFLKRSGVAYAEVDAQMTATAVAPLDEHYAKQWDLYEPTAGMNLPTAWDTATGTSQKVAVLDTGITSHPDLAANVVGGYDFVSNATFARDNNGRDANPADQGDWTTRNQCYGGSKPSNSSWHGTHVAGTIAAVKDATGVVGVAYNAKVMPVRVLGACGGTLADIADAITWASGGAVAGVPTLTAPAKVINMSLGGGGTCGATYQSAINGAVARGTTVVVAAGNSNASAASYQPSSCANVVVVAASDRQGNRAAYSNYGSVVDVTAPGGETATQANGILSTLNTGTTTPGAAAYAYYQGTSMATPHVAGLVALLLSKRGATAPATVESLLRTGTRPLLGSCTGGCGAGLVDAYKTVNLP